MKELSCENCAFYNPKSQYYCDFTDESPVICSVKMKRIKTFKKKKLEVTYNENKEKPYS